MTRRTWEDKLIGRSLPPVLKQLFELSPNVYGYHLDDFENEWTRDDEYRLMVVLRSEYREALFLPVFITLTEELKIDFIEIEAYVSYGPSHGRPHYVSPQQREINQVGRLMKHVFQFK